MGTVRAHLATLQGEERALYAALGRETLKLAAPHLAAEVVAEMEDLLSK